MEELQKSGTFDPKPEDTFLSRLEALDIDADTGMHYCADDEELYRDILSAFVESAEERAQRTEALYEQKDWEEYKVAVHALKSNAKTIGALTLSEHARELEEAAFRKDEPYIEAHHASLQKMAEELTKEIQKLL